MVMCGLCVVYVLCGLCVVYVWLILLHGCMYHVPDHRLIFLEKKALIQVVSPVHVWWNVFAQALQICFCVSVCTLCTLSEPGKTGMYGFSSWRCWIFTGPMELACQNMC